MSDEILVNITPEETRVAVVENGIVQEVIIERSRKKGLVGNIYKGEVCRVLPGMHAAFVDIGFEWGAFLHVSDLNCRDRENQGSEDIDHLLRERQELVVQVIKDPLGSKGARLTTKLSIPSRYMVYMPYSDTSGLSLRIENEIERERLKACIDKFKDEFSSGGFIARTAAECVDEEYLRSDMMFLVKLWHSICERMHRSSSKTLIHGDLPLSIRALRDLYRKKVEKIRVDSKETYQQMVKFSEEFLPDVTPMMEHYSGERPIFDMFSIEDDIQKALARKVFLKSGGYLVFDQNEAMTTIDVNTGGYVGKRSLEETIFKTNLEAAQTLVRQLRLRNLGGIIIIDFIDMQDDDHKIQVMRELEKNLEKDHAKTCISEVSTLGLVEMTRKRTRGSLENILCESCSSCDGRGVLKTAETTCLEIFREIIREVRQYSMDSLLVLASNDVVERLLDEEAATLAELEKFLSVRIRIRAEIHYTQEQYDVVIL